MNKACWLIVFGLAAGVAFAQTPSKQPGTAGSAVVTSEPGKASAVMLAEVRATVVAIDKATRTVTLKGPQRTVDVVAGDEVKNFDKIRVGDEVAVRYHEALSLELRKARQPLSTTSVEGGVRAPGGKPGAAAAREITILADVVEVDPAKSIITLKGPRGNVVDLKVNNPDHFKVVKKGDQIEAVYTEAIAIELIPAKPAGTKK